MPESRPAADHQPDARPPDDGIDTATRLYADHRELLFSIVYNLLGSIADTEDVLQETWLSWVDRYRATDAEPIADARAYLVRVAVNQALRRRDAINRRRESYVGPWLPEPIVEPSGRSTPLGSAGLIGSVGLAGSAGAEPQAGADEALLRAETVSIALLVVLETLTPAERAVFVLHEAFGYAHTEIAEILGRSASACRQLGHRARRHVQARRPRYRTDATVQRRVTERFLAAALGGDLAALLRLLAPDVTMWGDGGGKGRAAAPRPILGRDKVVRTITGTAARGTEDLEVDYRLVNGDPAAVLYADHEPVVVMVLDIDESERVSSIYAVTNPDKLRHLDQPDHPEHPEHLERPDQPDNPGRNDDSVEPS